MEFAYQVNNFVLNIEPFFNKIEGKRTIFMKIFLFESHPVENYNKLQLLYNRQQIAPPINPLYLLLLITDHIPNKKIVKWRSLRVINKDTGKNKSSRSIQQIKMQQRESKQKRVQQTLSKINYLSLQGLQSSLSDHSTCSSYIESIKSNRCHIDNKVVLHLTTNCNCIYSIFAAEMGAKKVFCVINGHGEIQQKNKYMMEEIIKENQWDHVITVLFFREFNFQVDVIIGQPMGYNLIYDGLLDRMIQVRDLHMKDVNKGLILPNKIRYKCAFIRDQYFIDKKVDFWDKVYGVPMCSMKNWISHQPMVRFVDPSLIVSEATKFLDFDIRTVSYEEIDNIKAKINIKTPMDIVANGVTMWFQLVFVKADGQIVQVKASPWCQMTKWTQMTLYGKNAWQLKGGSHKKIEFSGKKNHIEGSVVMKLRVDNGDEQIYHFS